MSTFWYHLIYKLENEIKVGLNVAGNHIFLDFKWRQNKKNYFRPPRLSNFKQKTDFSNYLRPTLQNDYTFQCIHWDLVPDAACLVQVSHIISCPRFGSLLKSWILELFRAKLFTAASEIHVFTSIHDCFILREFKSPARYNMRPLHIPAAVEEPNPN